MNRYFYTLFAVILFQISLFAQVDERIAPGTAPLSTVEQILLPALDNDKLLEEEMERRKPGLAPKFAQNRKIGANPDFQGTWESITNDRMVWRLRVKSPQAKSLNLGFSQFKMPQGGTLVIYTPDYRKIIGPFSATDNEEHGELWTPVIEGDELVIEVQIPTEKRVQLQLKLKSVGHDFVGFGRMMSGSCNVDVACGMADGFPEIDQYRDIIQSVAVYGMNGENFCTGFLVNNTRQDCTPLFLTANHCEITNSNAASVVVYWNFENSFCRQPGSPASGEPGDGQLNDFNSGALFRANHPPSDMTLLELDDPVSSTAEAFFAGWDATATVPTGAVSVHHPSSDEKRISFDDDALAIGTWPDGDLDPNGDHLVVASWDLGTTEGGSSGGPLFNLDKRVIGQLHGGSAACDVDDFDAYGWVYTSWEGGGSPSTRLKDWLDPDNTGILVLDGRYQSACSLVTMNAVEEACAPDPVVYTADLGGFSGNVTFSTSDVPAGTSVDFSANPASPNSNVTITLTGTSSLAEGSYSFGLEMTDGSNTIDQVLFLKVAEAAPPAPNLLSPDHQEVTGVTPFFNWSAGAEGSTYDFQLATDEDFNNLEMDETDLVSNVIQAANILDGATTFYWRARTHNPCGAGNWSSTRTFTTGDLECSVNAAADVPVTLPESVATTSTSEISISTSGEVADVNITNLNGTHTWIDDLVFTLTSPEGTVVTLIQNACDDLDDFDLSLDDEAVVADWPCPMTDGGTYQPEGSLSDFIGEEAQGTWTLTIEDQFDGDGGALNGWNLDLCILDKTTSTRNNELATAIKLFPNPTKGELRVDLPELNGSDAQLTLLSVTGQAIQEWQTSDISNNLNLTSYPAGIYLLRVQIADRVGVRKVILQ